MNNVNEMTDEEALKTFIDLLENRVSITTGFLTTGEGDVFTHQFLKVRCGELEVTSAPEILGIPLVVAPASEQVITIH